MAKKAPAKKSDGYIAKAPIRRLMKKEGAALVAADALDIALSAENIDICDVPFDYDPVDPDYDIKLDYSKSLAFKDFRLYTNPNIYEFSDIDTPPSHMPRLRDADTDYFSLFEFSAKYDPVPTMLTQNHVNVVKGFMGQTTMFREEMIKPSLIMNIINMQLRLVEIGRIL